jgi:hypothetical protein
MMQTVRRKPFDFQPARRAKNFVSRKSKLVERAFLSLAAANLFLVSSAFSFFWLVRR